MLTTSGSASDMRYGAQEKRQIKTKTKTKRKDRNHPIKHDCPKYEDDITAPRPAKIAKLGI